MAKGLSKAQMAKIARVLGMDPTKNAPQAISKAPLPKQTELVHQFEAEGVLNTLRYPEWPRVMKKCGNCEESFSTAYRAVGYCSDECRRLDLAKNFGIEWVEAKYRTQSEIEIWGGRVPPQTIPPDALAVMKHLVNLAEERQGHPIVPWNPQERKPRKPLLTSRKEKPKPQLGTSVPVPIQKEVLVPRTREELDADLDLLLQELEA